MTDFETRRRQHVRDALALLPRLSAALEWPAERIAAERDQRLRDLVRHAIARSPWHRERLAGVDLEASGEHLVAQIPVMTKADLMANFDDVVTDPRLTLGNVEQHLEGLPASGYLLDRYTTVASSGSTGPRGCFVYGWEEFATSYVGSYRYLLRERHPDGTGPVMANVAAGHPSHTSAALNRVFAGPHLDMRKHPVTTPVPQLVSELNACRPEILAGYPSALHVLAQEAAQGRLTIAPRRIVVFAEPLLPAARSAIEEVWGIPVGNFYGTSEGGPTAIPCDLAQTHLCDDLVLIEPVDLDGRPVPEGVASAKVYLTNLYNHTLPLIRLEISDEVTVLPGQCPCGSAHRRIDDVHGRLDDHFHYDVVTGPVAVHPHVFRSLLGRRPQIVEYQVRQRADGATIDVRALAAFDRAALEAELVTSLRRLGVSDAQVRIELVEHLERGVTGKIKRFVPLCPAATLR